MNKYKVVESLIRAKQALEQAGARNHSSSCPVDNDPDYMGPCSKSCSANNGGVAHGEIEKALQEILK